MKVSVLNGVNINVTGKREEFRQKSVPDKHTVGCVAGLGGDGYILALRYLLCEK